MGSLFRPGSFTGCGSKGVKIIQHALNVSRVFRVLKLKKKKGPLWVTHHKKCESTGRHA